MKEHGINRDMVQYYAQRAPEYDLTSYDRWPERQPDLQESAAALMEAFKERDVLEIGAGTGYWTQKMAQTARSVLATDINQSMLNEAQKKQYPEGKVTFMAADMYGLQHLPKRNGLFAGFIFSHVLKDDRPRFIDTMNSYVVPSGTVAFMDNNLTTGTDRSDEHGNQYRIRTREDGSKHEIVKNYPNEEEMRELLKSRASNVEFKNLKHFWMVIYKTLQ